MSEEEFDEEDSCDEEALDMLAYEGALISKEDAEALERLLDTNTADLETRARLIGYYFFRGQSEKDRERRIEHALWFIRQLPSTNFAGPYLEMNPKVSESEKQKYIEAENIFLEHLEKAPKDLDLIANAAHFFAFGNRKRAIEFLQAGKRLDPENSDWSEKLSDEYWRDGANDLALAEIENAVACESEDLIRFYLKTKLTEIAFDAAAYDRAKEAAEDLLQIASNYREDWNYGNAINEANTVLGRIALKCGDILKAKSHLLSSAKDADSPQNSSFGPAMELACELLNVQEKDTVLLYLTECAEFWEGHEELVKLWQQEIGNDKNPFKWVGGKVSKNR